MNPIPSTSTLTLPVSERYDHIRGPTTAPVTLVEYGDYECPFCGQAHALVTDIEAAAGNVLRFAYRHFPLTNLHPHAARAAEAAEAAGAQGKFWQMHDMLFEHQEALSEDDVVGYAARIALDMEAFMRDLAEHRHAARVREHFMSGVRSGVNGTPTFFVNGVRYDGPRDVDAFLALIDELADRRLRAGQ